jgi:hypothetical protein
MFPNAPTMPWALWAVLPQLNKSTYELCGTKQPSRNICMTFKVEWRKTLDITNRDAPNHQISPGSIVCTDEMPLLALPYHVCIHISICVLYIHLLSWQWMLRSSTSIDQTCCILATQARHFIPFLALIHSLTCAEREKLTDACYLWYMRRL